MIIIDRFEGNYAIIEIDGAILKIDRQRIDQFAKEGDVLRKKKGYFSVDKEQTQTRKEAAASRFDRLKKNG